jgi:hypothetical protein
MGRERYRQRRCSQQQSKSCPPPDPPLHRTFLLSTASPSLATQDTGSLAQKGSLLGTIRTAVATIYKFLRIREHPEQNARWNA